MPEDRLMNASFEEKSVWIQLIGLVIVLSSYCVLAARTVASGVTQLIHFVPLLTIAIVLLVALLAVGHIVVAVASRPEGRYERDQLIAWRAESRSSWVLGVGVIAAIICLVVVDEPTWVAHGLLLSLFLSEIVKDILQLVAYHRGV